MSHLFGPVISRRLGRSLGIDLVPHKTCTLDCIYCECGKTTDLTIQRKEFVNPDKILDQLAAFINSNDRAEILTFSGFGEPTLYSELDYLVSQIRKMTDIPLALLTNSTLLSIPDVKNASLKCSLVIPSLDAGCLGTFEQVNQPHPELSFQDMTTAIREFSHEFTGQLWLELFFCHGINDSEEELNDIADIVKTIKAKRIQVNSVDRPPAFSRAKTLNDQDLDNIAKKLGAEVICRRKSAARYESSNTRIADDLCAFLKRRPETLSHLQEAFQVNSAYLSKVLSELENKGLIHRENLNGQTFYRAI